jgi:hypothetical protein
VGNRKAKAIITKTAVRICFVGFAIYPTVFGGLLFYISNKMKGETK